MPSMLRCPKRHPLDLDWSRFSEVHFHNCGAYVQIKLHHAPLPEYSVSRAHPRAMIVLLTAGHYTLPVA